MSDPAAPASVDVRRAWLTYTALRLLVFLGTAGLLVVALDLNGFPLLLVALLVSSILSLLVLRTQRTALVAAQLARRERKSAERAARRTQLGGS